MIVVTHTPHEIGPFFNLAVESAREAVAGSYACHSIIAVRSGEYYEARKAAWQSGGYVGLLDSDDTFACGFSLQSFEPHLNGVGVVYGQERKIDSAGRFLSDPSPRAAREDIFERASAIHHFAAVNTDCLPSSLFAACENARAFMCLDWIVKAYAALTEGATFVPGHSYNWRQHPGQVTAARAAEVAQSVIGAQRVIRQFVGTRHAFS